MKVRILARARRLVRVSLACAAFAVAIVAALPAADQDLRPSQVRKKGKQAAKLWKAGQIPEALELYDEVLAATPDRVVPERGDALYGVVMAFLLPDSPRHDLEAAGPLLDEYLERFSRHHQHREVAVFRHLLEARSLEAETAAALRRAQDDRAKELESERRKQSQASGEHEAEMESLRRELAEAREKLAATTGELKSTKEELAKKDEALEKLTRRVVGRAGDG